MDQIKNSFLTQEIKRVETKLKKYQEIYDEDPIKDINVMRLIKLKQDELRILKLMKDENEV